MTRSKWIRKRKAPAATRGLCASDRLANAWVQTERENVRRPSPPTGNHGHGLGYPPFGPEASVGHPLHPKYGEVKPKQ